MKNYKLIARLEGIIYDSQMEFKGNPAWRLSNVECIQWENDNQVVELSVEKGTLTRDVVSHDGKYLMLVFRGNTEFAEPCNMAVYDMTGILYRVVCAPFLTNHEMIERHGGRVDMQGEIIGCGSMKNKNGEDVMAVGIWFNEIARSQYVDCYRESREFNPETGEMGEIISWELPWR
jgi:hypothetical protein